MKHLVNVVATTEIQLDNLESQLNKYIDGFESDYEAIYRAGVAVGRNLERTNSPDFRLPFFVNLESERSITEHTRVLHREIADLLLKQVHAAINEIIETNCSWTVGTDSYYRRDGRFSDEIIEKYGIAFESIEQSHRGGHFETFFSFRGKLEKCFDSYGYIPTLEVALDNDSGEDNMTLNCEADVENLYHSILRMPTPTSLNELDKLRKLKASLEKILMFEIIGRT